MRFATVLAAAGSLALAGVAQAAHGDGSEGSIMGPVSFLWPDDREWDSADDNIGPCGSSEGVTERTEFPLCKSLSIARLCLYLLLRGTYSRLVSLTAVQPRAPWPCPSPMRPTRSPSTLLLTIVSLVLLTMQPPPRSDHRLTYPQTRRARPSSRSRSSTTSPRSSLATSATKSMASRAPWLRATMPPSSCSTGRITQARTTAKTRPSLPAPIL